MVYLTTDTHSVRLIRRHGSFRSASNSPFVPPTSDATTRWKHYVFRAFAGRHVLRLVAAAGTRDEGAAISAFLSGLRGLLPRVCRRGGLGGAPLPLSDEDTEVIARLEKAMRCVAFSREEGHTGGACCQAPSMDAARCSGHATPLS